MQNIKAKITIIGQVQLINITWKGHKLDLYLVSTAETYYNLNLIRSGFFFGFFPNFISKQRFTQKQINRVLLQSIARAVCIII